MSFLGSVDWNQIEDIGFKPLPAGTYGAKITSANISPNKKGDGKYIKLELTLVGRKGIKGRKVFEYLTIQHKNEQVVSIALGKLKKLIISVGKEPDSLEDTSELVGEMVAIKLKLENSPEFGPQNRVTGFDKFDEDLLNAGLSESSEEY